MTPRAVARNAACLALAFAAGEAAARLVRFDGPARPLLLDRHRRVLGDLSEITRFFGSEDAEPSAGSLTQMPPGIVVHGWYDRPRWDYFDARDCVTYQIDSLGFRDEELPLAKPPGELRVIAIGDSFTFAAGVQLEDCWVQQLEQRLAKARGAPVEVVNAGFARGFRPASYATWLAEQGMKLDPDAVIVAFCLNDISLDIPMYIPLTVADQRAPGPSRLVDDLRTAFARFAPERAPTKTGVIKAQRVVASHADEWRSTQEALLEIQRQLAERGVRLGVVIFPMFSQLKSGYLLGELHQLVARFCADHAIDHFDLLPTFLGQDERELWVHPTDQHPNDVGQRMIADALAGWFAARPLEPRTR